MTKIPLKTRLWNKFTWHTNKKFKELRNPYGAKEERELFSLKFSVIAIILSLVAIVISLYK